MKKFDNDDRYIRKWAKKIKALNLMGAKCCQCGTKNIFVLEFHHNGGKERCISELIKGGHRWSAIELELKKCILLCNNCHHELHYSDQMHKSKSKMSDNVLDFKRLNHCLICGYDKNPKCLGFHHKYGDKKFNISDASLINILELKEELEKCVLLCRNCHQIEHTDVKRFNKFKKAIYRKIKTYEEHRPSPSHNRVIKLYLSGKSQGQISRIIGRTKSVINRILKKRKGYVRYGRIKT
jgi:hypothetical protein